MGWRVLVSAPYFIPALSHYEPILWAEGVDVIVSPVAERLSEATLLDLIADIDGVLCGDDQFTERVFETARRLKVISKWGTGVDSIDRQAASRFGVRIYNTPGAFTDPAADSVLGYMLAFARRLPWMDRAMRNGRWEKIPCRSLAECTLGVVGLGNIGRAVVRRAVSFGMRVVGTDPVIPPPAFVQETGIELTSLEVLLREADFVSLNCDLNPTSYRLISTPQFALMKPGAVLINTARGPVVDESALIEALRDGRIGGAALDVFEVEPLPHDSPLRALENSLLAPHNANSSPAAASRVHENTVRNLLKGLRESV